MPVPKERLQALVADVVGRQLDLEIAVSKQLRGLVRLLAGHQSDAAFGDASALFAEAASLVPSNAAASNLAAVTALYRDWRNRETTIDFEATANRFWESIGSDPADQTALTNCWTSVCSRNSFSRSCTSRSKWA